MSFLERSMAILRKIDRVGIKKWINDQIAVWLFN